MTYLCLQKEDKLRKNNEVQPQAQRNQAENKKKMKFVKLRTDLVGNNRQNVIFVSLNISFKKIPF